jgi:hypothetical protein
MPMRGLLPRSSAGPAGHLPGQLMMASVLQSSENLTVTQAAEAVQDRITWKYALGLEAEDPVRLDY